MQDLNYDSLTNRERLVVNTKRGMGIVDHIIPCWIECGAVCSEVDIWGIVGIYNSIVWADKCGVLANAWDSHSSLADFQVIDILVVGLLLLDRATLYLSISNVIGKNVAMLLRVTNKKANLQAREVPIRTRLWCNTTSRAVSHTWSLRS